MISKPSENSCESPISALPDGWIALDLSDEMSIVTALAIIGRTHEDSLNRSRRAKTAWVVKRRASDPST